MAEDYTQEVIPEFVELTAQDVSEPRLDKRAAFGRVPKAEFLGADPSALREGLEQVDLHHATPTFLRTNLFGATKGYAYRGLAFRPDEYEVIVRNHDSFSKAVKGKTLSAHFHEGNIDWRNERAERSGLHAFESKLTRIEGMIEGYEQERESLELLLKKIRTPGYAHMSEGDLRILVTKVKDISWRNMIDVTAVQQEWDADTATKAQTAMEYWAGSEDYKRNFRYWQLMSDLALRYTRSKCILAKQNRNATEKLLKQQ